MKEFEYRLNKSDESVNILKQKKVLQKAGLENL
jgi:hypothetical protein